MECYRFCGQAGEVRNDLRGGIITLSGVCERRRGLLSYLCLPAVQVNQESQGSRSFLLNLALHGLLAFQALQEGLGGLVYCWRTRHWEPGLVMCWFGSFGLWRQSRWRSELTARRKVPGGREFLLTAEKVLTHLSGNDSHHVLRGEVALRISRQQDEV